MKQNKPLQQKAPLRAKTSLKASPKPKKQPKPKVSRLKRKADALFSLATRYRFAERVNGEWLVECVTCGIIKPLKEMQCGHFQSRRFNATRYSEENCAPQCYGCNVMRQGEQYKFAAFVDEFYGEGTAKRLEQEARQPHPFKPEELQAIIDESTEQIKFYESRA